MPDIMTEEKIKQTLVAAFITAASAADILAVGHSTIYRWINEGRLESLKIPGPGKPTYRIKSSSVRRLLGTVG